jgi:hypothetical protein
MFRLLRATIRLTIGHIEQTVNHFVQFMKCVMELTFKKTRDLSELLSVFIQFVREAQSERQ